MNASLPSTRPRSRRRFPGVAILLALIVVGGGIAAYKSRHHVFPKRFGVVVPGRLYRSGQLSRFLVESTLKEHGIKTIVDLSGLGDEHLDQRAEREAAERLGIQVHRFPLKGDGTGEIESYASALEVIVRSLEANQPVLVHCAAGSQRTGGTIAAYRLLFQGESPSRVLGELEDYGWDPLGDRDLIRYLDRNWEPLTVSLIRKGVLRSAPAELPRLTSIAELTIPLARSSSPVMTH